MLVGYMRDSDSAALAAIRDTGKLEKETLEALTSEIDSFKNNRWNQEPSTTSESGEEAASA